MARAFSDWNIEHDACAIYWSKGTKPMDIPADAINHVLGKMYQDDSLAPFLYCVYDGEFWVGLLVAGNFNPSNEQEIWAVWNDIRESAAAAPRPEPYNTQEWNI